MDWHYANGETMLGLLAVARASGDRKYHDFVRKFCDFTLANAGYFRWQYDSLHILRGSYHRLFRRSMLDDTGGPALPFLELYDEASGNNWRELVSAMAEFVSIKQDRLPDGTLCRPEPEAMTVWADDMFMSVPFMLRMAKITGDSTWYDDAVRQIINFARYLRDPQTGLFYHGWFSGANKNACVFWGRANGWVAWALSEALLSLPDRHPGHEKVLEIYRDFMKTLIRFQDSSGMWHQVLDHPESYPETSCSAMFVLALARGVNQGWLNRDFGTAAEKGWAGIRAKIDSTGVVHGICRGTGIGPDLNYYMKRPTFDNDPRGLGAVLVAATEVSAFSQK
ncbi:MAG: glycoside hydrolase family 88 protein [Calditrichia bacterium]